MKEEQQINVEKLLKEISETISNEHTVEQLEKYKTELKKFKKTNPELSLSLNHSIIIIDTVIRLKKLEKKKGSNISKKIFLSLSLSFFLSTFILLSSINSISAEEWGYNYLTSENGLVSEKNYSTLNVNNSQYLQGFTPSTLRDSFESYFNGIYCLLTGCEVSGDFNVTGDSNIGGDLVVTGNVTANYFIGDGSELTNFNKTETSHWSPNGTNLYYNNGNVGIGTGNPTQKLSVVGNLNVTGNITAPGNNSEVLFNDNGIINTILNFTYNKLTGMLTIPDLNVTSGQSIHLSFLTIENFGHFSTFDTNLGIFDKDQPNVFIGLFEINGSSEGEASLFLQNYQNHSLEMIKFNEGHSNNLSERGMIINEGGNMSIVTQDHALFTISHYENITKDEYGDIIEVSDLHDVLLLDDTTLTLDEAHILNFKAGNVTLSALNNFLNVNGSLNVSGVYYGDGSGLSEIGIPNLNFNFSSLQNFYNGAILETINGTVTSNGSTIYFNLEKQGTGDLTVIFDKSFHLFDSTPRVNITLTAGSDTSPQSNYVYILNSTKQLTVSTTSFPSEEFAPIATVIVQSAGTVQTDGALKVHLWTDHIKNGDSRGHLSHVNEWIREQHATWLSGVVQTLTITSNVGTPDNVDFATTSGIVSQLHPHSFPAFNTATGSKIYVVNNATDPYATITDLNELLTDSTGASMSGKYFNLVIWGVVSEDTGDSHLFVNLPSGSYNKQSDATADVSGYTDFSIPSDFKGTGFLISKLTLQHQVILGGTWTSIEEEDLLGYFPNTVAGGGTSAITTEFSDNTFKLFDETDVTKLLQFQLSGLTTAVTRILTIPDMDGTILTNNYNLGDINFDNNTLFLDAVNNYIGIGTTTPNATLDVNGSIYSQDNINVEENLTIGGLLIMEDQINISIASLGTLNTGSVNSGGNNATTIYLTTFNDYETNNFTLANRAVLSSLLGITIANLSNNNQSGPIMVEDENALGGGYAEFNRDNETFLEMVGFPTTASGTSTAILRIRIRDISAQNGLFSRGTNDPTSINGSLFYVSSNDLIVEWYNDNQEVFSLRTSGRVIQENKWHYYVFDVFELNDTHNRYCIYVDWNKQECADYEEQIFYGVKNVLGTSAFSEADYYCDCDFDFAYFKVGASYFDADYIEPEDRILTPPDESEQCWTSDQGTKYCMNELLSYDTFVAIWSTSEDEPNDIYYDQGNVGIGVDTNIERQLHVKDGTQDISALFESTNGSALISFRDNTTTEDVTIGALANNFVINTNDIQTALFSSDGVTINAFLDVIGSIKASDTFIFSDGRTQPYAATPDGFSWNINNAIFNQDFNVSSQDTIPNDVFFKSDGTKMYILGNFNDDVIQYNLTTAWDISTAIYHQSFDISPEEITPQGLYFRPDGTKMYVIGGIGDDVNEYDLSTTWDISTSVYKQNFNVSAEEGNPTDVFFKPDGTKMYVIGHGNDNVNEYDLSTPWDISTATYSKLFSVSTEEFTPQGIFFKSDGNKMYITGSASDEINEYDLSTPWDVSTALHIESLSIATRDNVPTGIFFKTDGTKMYFSGGENDLIYEYNLGLNILGKVGIGTSTPDVMLDVEGGDVSIGASPSDEQRTLSIYGNTSSPGRIQLFGGAANLVMTLTGKGAGTSIPAKIETNYGLELDYGAVSTENGFRVTRGGTTELQVKDGNVGIGTSAPNNNLHINSSGDAIMRLTPATSSDRSRIIFADETDTTIWSVGRETADQFNFYDAINGTNPFVIEQGAGANALYVDNGGNVGMGTPSPTRELTIYDQTSSYLSVSDNSGERMLIGYSEGVSVPFDNILAHQIIGDNNLHIASRSSSGTDMRFYTTATNTSEERMRIESDGSIGIGTISPAATLDVNGSGAFSGGDFSVNNSDLFVDVSEGRVGIGTTTPSNNLEVFGGTDASTFVDFTSDRNSVLRLMADLDDDSNLEEPEVCFYVDGDYVNALGCTGYDSEDDLVKLTYGKIHDSNGMVIDSSGAVGIGTENPLAEFHLLESDINETWSYDARTIGIFERNAGTRVQILSGSGSVGELLFSDKNNQGIGRVSYSHITDQISLYAGGEKLTVTSATEVGIGDSTPESTLDAVGIYSDTVGGTNRDLYVDNAGIVGYVSSSERYKNNISNISDTSWIYDLRPVTFNWNSDSHSDIGLIAEEVELINPDLVSYDLFEVINGSYERIDDREDYEEYISLDKNMTSGNVQDVALGNVTKNITKLAETVQYSKLVIPMLKEIQELKEENDLMKEDLCSLGVLRWC